MGEGKVGRQTAIELARYGKPAHIYIADLPRGDGGAAAVATVRDALPTPESDDAVAVKISFLDLDLGSLDAVQAAARRFRDAETRLDLLVLNAGIMPVRPATTADGYEVTFGVNYLGHALLTRLLLPTLLRTADARVVVVSSEGHSMAPKGGILFDRLKTPCEKMVPLPSSSSTLVAHASSH